MIRYVTGNILDDDAEALVNPVNCVGVMGAGLAQQFKHRFPVYDLDYRDLCESQLLVPGRVRLHRYPASGDPGCLWIVSFPTKRHWRDPSELVWIDDGLYDLIRLVDNSGIRSIALPMLGCGLGGLPWPDVLSLIKWHFSRLPDVDARVYGPNA